MIRENGLKLVLEPRHRIVRAGLHELDRTGTPLRECVFVTLRAGKRRVNQLQQGLQLRLGRLSKNPGARRFHERYDAHLLVRP